MAIILAVLVILAGAATWGFRHVGRWLVIQDALEPAHAIVALSGRMPARARQAAEIYRQGYAAQVWVIRPVSPAAELQQMNIPYVGEDFYNEKVLIHLGVPFEAIRVLEKPIVNTEEEVQEIADEVRRAGGQKVIVVTSKPHTRRVKAIWNARVGKSPRLLIRYASADDFDADHWWRHTYNALDVVREVLGLANTWAGFPVRPADHSNATGALPRPKQAE
ncbi:MAG TPA: YdcF family protein [Candidatus Acidoferrales bacterium]|nr:YdcF family protein [Candidatus Acidoferrales bacterium]